VPAADPHPQHGLPAFAMSGPEARKAPPGEGEEPEGQRKGRHPAWVTTVKLLSIGLTCHRTNPYEPRSRAIVSPAELPLSTKTCPNCNAEVPTVANLCKHCFHDFHMVVAKRKSPVFPILLFAAGTGIVTALTYGYVHTQHRTSRISVDAETESIVFTTTYASGTEVDRVYFKDVSNVEYVMNTRPRPFEVAIVTSHGDRFVYKQGEDPLDHVARTLGELIEKPVITKNEVETPNTIKKGAKQP
jgi:hypothetical protein